MSIVASRQLGHDKLQSLREEVLEYPGTFCHLPSVDKKVVKALALVDDLVENEGVPLKPLAASKVVTRYGRVPLTVRFDRGCSTNATGVVGFQVLDRDGAALRTRGEYGVGFTSNHSECLGVLRALYVVVQRGWQQRGDYILVQGDSSLVMNYLTHVQQCHTPYLQQVVEHIQQFIRQQHLRVAFQWIPREQNSVAEHACRVARRLQRHINPSPKGEELMTEASKDAQVAAVAPPWTQCCVSAGIYSGVTAGGADGAATKDGAGGIVSAAIGNVGGGQAVGRSSSGSQTASEAVCGEAAYEVGNDVAKEELVEVPMTMGTRARGRPRYAKPQDVRRQPAYQTVPCTLTSLACNSCDCQPMSELPLYCQDCYSTLLLNGFDDPTKGVALLHYIWFGSQMMGLADEQAKRVAEQARPFEVQLDRDKGERYQQFCCTGGRWKVVPARAR